MGEVHLLRYFFSNALVAAGQRLVQRVCFKTLFAGYSLKTILRKHAGDIALLIGNGINLYTRGNGSSGWADLLGSLALKYVPSHTTIPPGIGLTEFYDVLDLTIGSRPAGQLQREFCELMDEWSPDQQHTRVIAWAERHGASVLTTNFDSLLTDVGGLNRLSMFEASEGVRAPTDYYPWETYHARTPLTHPCSGFAVWQPHGMRSYHRSVRLGLSHYMGSVERARRWMYDGKQTRLLHENAISTWRGRHTWLQIFLTRPLLMFGLALEEGEVFMRWLLIERSRYFRKFPEREKPAWYIYPKGEAKPDQTGKLYFLKSLGIEPVEVAGYDAIYGPQVWK